MANRRRNFNFVELHDEEFEELSFLVAHLEIPNLSKTANPDGGLDAVVIPVNGGPAPRGVQAKHFTRAPKWSDCINSLDTAVETYDVRHLTFCFPRDLTENQIKAFREKLQERYSEVVVDYWSAGQLTARLLDSEKGRQIARYIFGEEELESLRRAISAQRDLDDAGQVFKALGASSSVLSDDPYFDYSLGSRPASLPAPPPAPGTTMRVEVQEGNSIQHIDALATSAAASADRMPQGELRLIGEEKVKRFQEFLRKGGRLTLADVEIHVEQLPKHFQEMLESSAWGQITLESVEDSTAVVTVEISGAADTFSVDFAMRAINPDEGWEWCLVGEHEGAELVVEVGPPSGRVNLTWRWNDDVTSPTEKRLQGVEFAEALSRPGTIRLVHRDSQRPLLSGASPEVRFGEEERILKQVFLDVLALEQWLGQVLSVPSTIQSTDANSLRQIALLLTGVKGSWNELKISMVDGGHSDALKAGGLLKIEQTLEVDLFGKRIPLGDEAIYIDKFKLAGAESKEDGSTEYVFKPNARSSRMLRRLERTADA